MNSGDLDAFTDILNGVFDVLGKDRPRKQAAMIWWSIMGDLSLDQFSAACLAFLRDGDAWPIPAKIRAMVATGWPGPEEAWNMIPKSESESGLMCDEMAAAYGACSDRLSAGDLVAARMAFLEAYKREVNGKTGEPKWWVSDGLWMDNESRLAERQRLLLERPYASPRLLEQTQKLIASSDTCGGKRSESDELVVASEYVKIARKALN